MKRTSGWLPYWDPQGGLASARAAGCADVCLFHWEITQGGGIRDLWEANASPKDILAIRKSGIPYLISTTTTFNGRGLLEVLHSGKAYKALAQAHVDVARKYGASGIDLDWESINFGTDGAAPQIANALVLFTQELKAAAGSMTVSVTLPGRTERAPGDWAIYDYKALGRIADQVRLMAYDFHEASSAPGPIAPTPYVKEVLAYALARVDPQKLILGVAGYGYDWHAPGEAVNVPARDLRVLEQRGGAVSTWDSQAAEQRITYPGHEAWLSIAQSVQKRRRMAENAGINGVSLWSLGEEQPGSWD